MTEFDGIDPKAFFEEQKRVYGEEHREQESYADFCKAAGEVMRSSAGQSMLAGLQKIVQFGSSKFRAEDDYNPHAAATRDGAAAAITEILLASRLDLKS